MTDDRHTGSTRPARVRRLVGVSLTADGAVRLDLAGATRVGAEAWVLSPADAWALAADVLALVNRGPPPSPADWNDTGTSGGAS